MPLNVSEIIITDADYRFIFDHITDAIFIHDLEGNIIEVNQTACELLGYPKEKLIRTGMINITAPDSRQLWPQKMEELKTKDWIFFEASLLTKDELIFPIEINCRALNIGGMILVLSSVRDMRERKKSESEKYRLLSIVESSADAILSKDLSGKILTWNKAAEKLYGYSSSEIVGKNVAILLPDDRKDEVNKILEKIKRGEEIERLETTRVAKNGQKIIVSLTISPIKDDKGQIIGASSIAYDITERKRTEEMVESHTKELEEMNKIMIGRELKMIELKEEITKLKEALEKTKS